MEEVKTARHAIVKDGVVEQATMIREGDDETREALGAIPCPEWVSKGDLYDEATQAWTQAQPVS